MPPLRRAFVACGYGDQRSGRIAPNPSLRRAFPGSGYSISGAGAIGEKPRLPARVAFRGCSISCFLAGLGWSAGTLRSFESPLMCRIREVKSTAVDFFHDVENPCERARCNQLRATRAVGFHEPGAILAGFPVWIERIGHEHVTLRKKRSARIKRVPTPYL